MKAAKSAAKRGPPSYWQRNRLWTSGYVVGVPDRTHFKYRCLHSLSDRNVRHRL